MKLITNTEIKKITPEWATELLSERWGEQRPVREGHIARLHADMEAGRWKISPDAILIVKGKLANGQHRLLALLRYGKALPFIVMESHDDELYKVIDAGLRRTASDGLIGIPYAKALPSIAKWVMAYERESFYPSSKGGAQAASGNGTIPYPTQVEMIDYCATHQDVLGSAASFVAPLYFQTKLLPVSIGGAMFVIGEHHGKLDAIKSFLTQVYIDGGSNAAGDLRNRLIQNRGSKAKLSPGYIFGITIKAFKFFCDERRPGTLKWVKEEAFPRI